MPSELHLKKDKLILIDKIFRILVILGDLERYRASALSLRNAVVNYSKAEAYYCRANFLNRYESDINPHLLLGTIANAKKQYLVAIYHYYRAITSNPPMISLIEHSGRSNQLKSAPLQNVKVLFHDIKEDNRKGKRLWNSSSPYASCPSLCRDVLIFHATIFSFCTYKRSKAPFNRDKELELWETETDISSCLRHSRTNITKKIKLLVNPSMASASIEAKTGSGVENKRNVSRLPPKLYIRMMFVTWFTILELSKDKETRYPSSSVRGNYLSNSIVLMRRVFPTQLSAQERSRFLTVIRENAWTLYIDMLAAYMISPDALEKENFLAGALPPLLLIGSSLSFPTETKRRNTVQMHQIFFCIVTRSCKRIFFNYVVKLHALFADDIHSLLSEDRGNATCTDHMPQTVEEIEFYGFPPLDRLENFVDKPFLVDTSKRLVEPKLVGSRAHTYRLRKLCKYMQVLVDMKPMFVRDKNCVCFIEKYNDGRKVLYRVADVADKDMEKRNATERLDAEGAKALKPKSSVEAQKCVSIGAASSDGNFGSTKDSDGSDIFHCDESSVSTSPSININSSPINSKSLTPKMNVMPGNSLRSLSRCSDIKINNTRKDSEEEEDMNHYDAAFQQQGANPEMSLSSDNDDHGALISSPVKNNGKSTNSYVWNGKRCSQKKPERIERLMPSNHNMFERSIFYDINRPSGFAVDNHEPPITYVSYLISSSGALQFDKASMMMEDYVTLPFDGPNTSADGKSSSRAPGDPMPLSASQDSSNQMPTYAEDHGTSKLMTTINFRQMHSSTKNNKGPNLADRSAGICLSKRKKLFDDVTGSSEREKRTRLHL